MTFQTRDNNDSIWKSAMAHKEALIEPLAQFFYDHTRGEVVGIKKELFETYVRFRRSEDQENLEKSLDDKSKQQQLVQILSLPRGQNLNIKVNKVKPQGMLLV